MLLHELLAANRSYRGFRQTPKLTYQQLCQLVELTGDAPPAAMFSRLNTAPSVTTIPMRSSCP